MLHYLKDQAPLGKFYFAQGHVLSLLWSNAEASESLRLATQDLGKATTAAVQMQAAVIEL